MKIGFSSSFYDPRILWRWSIAVVLLLISLLSIRYSLLAQWGEDRNYLNFGDGNGIQIVDPSGTNRMPIWPGNADVTVHFSLSPLLPDELALRYPRRNSNHDYHSGLTPVVNWEQSFTAGYGSTPQFTNFPANLASGIYVIEASGTDQLGRPGYDAEFVVVSKNVLILKKDSGGQIVAWVSDLHGQNPVVGQTVTLYDQQGITLATATTDEKGIANFAAVTGKPYMAIAEGDGETTVAGLSSEWNSANSDWWWWGAWQENTITADPYTIYLHTDRPIYRPNQTIYYQAIVRKQALTDNRMPPAGMPATLELRDARNNIVASQSATLDEFGSLHGEFTIGDAPPLGSWDVTITVDRQRKSQHLRVEEYRKPEYQVSVSTAREHLIAGDSTQITVAADYYFGQPVANASVKLKVFRYTIPRYGWYWWYGGAISPYSTQPMGEFAGTTDANGKWSTAYTPDASDQYDSVYTFQAEITDDRNLPVTGSKELKVHWNSFAISLSPTRWGYKSNETVEMKIATRNHDGSAAAGKRVTVRILYDYWNQSSGSDAMPPVTGTTDSQGVLKVSYDHVPQGWYRVEATSDDLHDRTLRTVNYLWVYNPASGSWYYTNSSELSILTDKTSYAPGDSARLLIQSKINGLALLTLEREGIYREQIVRINGPVTSVDVAIDEQLAPNVVARLHIFDVAGDEDPDVTREGRLVMAQTNLSVPANHKKLEIEIHAEAAKYRPAENATLTLKVKDNHGNPIRARISLALVDEAIYALQADLSANLFDTFWGARSSNVTTYDSLRRFPYGYNGSWPPTSDLSPTEPPTPSTAGNAPSAESPSVRRRFEDTAYWNATITSDAEGKATVTIKLPDNLTTWRINAKAIDLDSRTGSAQSKLLVTQEIIARPALPRFSIVGDRFQTGLVGQNFSGAATSGSAQMSANALVLLNNGSQGMDLLNGGSSAVHWTAVAASSGTGLVTTSLQTGAGRDIVELPFLIKPFAVPDRWRASGQANPRVTEIFNLPLNAVAEESRLELRLSPSLALGVLDGLDELIDYPYGCVEQTMSRLLPSAVAAKTYTDLGIPNPKADKLPKIIATGLQKIYGYQHNDGGWGWFYDDTGGTFLTAYVLFGLISVEDAGYKVDQLVVAKGLHYLDNNLDSTTDAGVQAFAHYIKALAGKGDLAATQALIHKTGAMDASQIAALALALHLNGNDSDANRVLDTLLTQATETPTTAHWQLSDSSWNSRYWQTMASNEKNTALALRALATLRPAEPRLSKAVRWLLEHRKGAGWGSTQATSFAVLGLVDVIKATGELQGNYSYTVKLNHQTIASGTLTPQTATQPIVPIILSGEQLGVGDNLLQIERSAGMGSLYYTALLDKQLYFDGFTPVSSLDQGLSLERSYQLAEGSARDDGAYNVGDLVEVTLSLKNSQELWYVLISDPIPAGFEVVEERMNRSSWSGYYDDFHWQDWGYNQKNVRDDQVEFFVTSLWQGDHRYTYLMRATTAGDFSVLPATASPMYKDEIWGRSASQKVVIAPEALTALPALAGDFDHSCQITTFDTQLTATSFGNADSLHDLNRNGRVDLRDIAAVGSWRGTICGTQRVMPGTVFGSASFTLVTDHTDLWIGDELRLTVSLDSFNRTGSDAASADAVTLDGFELLLNIDPSHLTIKQIEVNPALGKVLPLGPHIQGNILAVGLYDLPARLVPGTELATLVFDSSSVGSTAFSVANASAVDGAGRQMEATATGTGTINVDGEQVWLPLVSK